MKIRNTIIVLVAVLHLSPAASAQSNDELQCDWWGREIHPVCDNRETGWGTENGQKCISKSACLGDQPSDRGGLIVSSESSSGSSSNETNGPAGYTFAANEGGTVNVTGTVNIAYGAKGAFRYLNQQTSDVDCTNTAFGGDPLYGVKKACYTKMVSVGASSSSTSTGGTGGDQCNTTAQCQAIYGNQATDCQDSRSSQSVCMCGAERCDGAGGGSGSGSSSGGTVGGSKVLLETGGLVAIESESYSSIDNKDYKANWFITSPGNVPNVRPDPDGAHTSGASGDSYLELLPDTRVTHDDTLIKSGVNTNLATNGGEGPTVNYRVYFNTPGLYYVWLRAYSTGSEDNGAHVGINGNWSSSGERVQWCTGKNRWTWSSAQRVDSNHCGIPKTITLNVPSKGIHTISVSMREDGFELDKIILAKERSFEPSGKSIAQKFYQGGDSGANNKLGKFDLDKDFLLGCYDNLPDVDDLQSMAALGTMLRDPRFAKVDYYAVVGCRGNQPTKFKLITNSEKLADLAFGQGNWSKAQKDQVDRRGYPIWSNAVNNVVDRAMPKLEAGGHLWIADAGQSDFSADVVREVLRRNNAINAKNIHVVQHSQWNQNMTSSDDLAYLRDKADYRKIPDGNDLNNGTPGYQTSNGSNWSRVLGNEEVGAIWREARDIANEWNGIKNGHENKAISNGGFDFSDTSESVYIFELMQEANDVDDFFDEFL